MTYAAPKNAKAVALIAVALVMAALGIYVAYTDDPSLPGLGPAGIGLLLMVVGVVLGIRASRNALATWAARTVMGIGVITALVAALLIHAAAITAPLFSQLRDVPSVIDQTPAPQYAAAVERAQEVVRAAVLEEHLPGVSVAVGAGLPSGASAKEGGTVVWAEGFGWRDVDTRTPVTPNTRFNIGTAASAVTADAVARLGLTHTGADSATEWSPEHVGEPEENFPGFTVIRHVIFRPLGLAPSQPLPGDRATFYVPRSDENPRTGRRLMYMRDLACCARTMAFYSTASDLVRVGAATGDSVNGTLAGGMVMSMMALRDRAIVVVVLSNIAHANTSALAVEIGDAFANQGR
jgi:CubicO group peptidase (beta-lactamase class C family)